MTSPPPTGSAGRRCRDAAAAARRRDRTVRDHRVASYGHQRGIADPALRPVFDAQDVALPIRPGLYLDHLVGGQSVARDRIVQFQRAGQGKGLLDRGHQAASFPRFKPLLRGIKRQARVRGDPVQFQAVIGQIGAGRVMDRSDGGVVQDEAPRRGGCGDGEGAARDGHAPNGTGSISSSIPTHSPEPLVPMSAQAGRAPPVNAASAGWAATARAVGDPVRRVRRMTCYRSSEDRP